MNEAKKGSQVMPGKGPSEAPGYKAYSDAKPLNHEVFSQDALTRYNQALMQMATQVQAARNNLRDPDVVLTFRSHVSALLKEVDIAIESMKLPKDSKKK